MGYMDGNTTCNIMKKWKDKGEFWDGIFNQKFKNNEAKYIRERITSKSNVK